MQCGSFLPEGVTGTSGYRFEYYLHFIKIPSHLNRAWKYCRLLVYKQYLCSVYTPWVRALVKRDCPDDLCQWEWLHFLFLKAFMHAFIPRLCNVTNMEHEIFFLLLLFCFFHSWGKRMNLWVYNMVSMTMGRYGHIFLITKQYINYSAHSTT